MSARDLIQVAVLFGVLILITPYLWRHMHRVFSGEQNWWSRLFGPIERFIYRVAGVDGVKEMRWTTYAIALMAFNLLGIGVLMTVQMTQKWLPLNPQGFDNIPFALALNTAVSFVTNTNWQAYSGEAAMSYFTQMAGLAVQNFVSAAVGIAVVIALA